MITAQQLRKLTLRTPSRPGRPAYVSAASGLVRVGRFIYVVADDELHLGVFSLDNDDPGELLPLFPGELPLEPRQRKKHKPDMEALALLPAMAAFPYGALLALGSASRPNRRRGAILPLTANSSIDSAAIQRFQPDGLYDLLEAKIGELNLEGAFVDGEHLVLLQRANKGNDLNAIIRLSLPVFIAALRDSSRFGACLLDITPISLGVIDGVPLAFTDGMALTDGHFIFSAVAEDTSDSYNDGVCLGSVIGVASTDGKVKFCEQVDSPWKVEGVSAVVQGDGIGLLLVTDADDELVPSVLFSARIEGNTLN